MAARDNPAGNSSSSRETGDDSGRRRRRVAAPRVPIEVLTGDVPLNTVYDRLFMLLNDYELGLGREEAVRQIRRRLYSAIYVITATISKDKAPQLRRLLSEFRLRVTGEDRCKAYRSLLGADPGKRRKHLLRFVRLGTAALAGSYGRGTAQFEAKREALRDFFLFYGASCEDEKNWTALLQSLEVTRILAPPPKEPADAAAADAKPVKAGGAQTEADILAEVGGPSGFQDMAVVLFNWFDDISAAVLPADDALETIMLKMGALLARRGDSRARFYDKTFGETVQERRQAMGDLLRWFKRSAEESGVDPEGDMLARAVRFTGVLARLVGGPAEERDVVTAALDEVLETESGTSSVSSFLLGDENGTTTEGGGGDDGGGVSSASSAHVHSRRVNSRRVNRRRLYAASSYY